jgi:hypothetical protein
VLRHRPRRAASAVVLAVAAAAAAAAVVPAAAATSTSPILIDAVTSPTTEPGLLSIQVEATSNITSLTVYIDSGGTTELTIPFSDLSLTSGSTQDGIWTVQSPITTSELSLGTYQVTADASDSGGDNLTGLSAPEPFFFGLYPDVSIAADTTTLSYSEQSVTFSGQVTADSPTGLSEGVAGQPVSITGSEGGSWSTTTDQNGNYSLTVAPNLADGTGLAASFSASVSAGTGIAQASSQSLELTGDVDPVEVTVTLSKSTADYGSPVTISGTAEYESDGIPVPLTSTTIDITGTDYYTGGSANGTTATTNGSGDFSAVLPAQPTTTWIANPAPNQFLTPSVSELGAPNSATLTVILPTSTTRLRIAYNPAGQITASGCLGLASAVRSYPDLTPPADADLYLQYSRTAHGPWRTIGSLGDSGAPACRGATGFGGALHPLSLSGHYRVHFTGQLLYQGSLSPAGYAATVPTRIAGFRITPRAVSGHGRIRVSGQLQQNASSWKGLGNARITIYIEPAGGTTWYWYKHVHVPNSGRFRVSFADPVSGHWAVGYAGDSSHLESLSRILYVSASGTTASLSQALGAHSLSGRATRALIAAR